MGYAIDPETKWITESTIKDTLKIQVFTAVYQKRNNRYIAWIEEIPGVNTQGKTKREVRENLREALSLILEANRTLSRNGEKYTSIREPLKIGIPAFA